MREISCEKITETVARLCIKANTVLPPELCGTEQELQSSLEEVLNSIDNKKYKTDIIFDMENE